MSHFLKSDCVASLKWQSYKIYPKLTILRFINFYHYLQTGLLLEKCDQIALLNNHCCYFCYSLRKFSFKTVSFHTIRHCYYIFIVTDSFCKIWQYCLVTFQKSVRSSSSSFRNSVYTQKT